MSTFRIIFTQVSTGANFKLVINRSTNESIFISTDDLECVDCFSLDEISASFFTISNNSGIISFPVGHNNRIIRVQQIIIPTVSSVSDIANSVSATIWFIVGTDRFRIISIPVLINNKVVIFLDNNLQFTIVNTEDIDIDTGNIELTSTKTRAETFKSKGSKQDQSGNKSNALIVLSILAVILVILLLILGRPRT